MRILLPVTLHIPLRTTPGEGKWSGEDGLRSQGSGGAFKTGDQRGRVRERVSQRR